MAHSFYLHSLMQWLRILSTCLLVCALSQAKSQTALVQIIHNSADTSVAAIDVWHNSERVAEGLSFHYATPFLTLPASDTALWELRHAGDTTQSPPLFTWTTALPASSKHIFVINGVNDSAHFTPFVPLHLDHRIEAIDLGASTAGVDITFCHGITDIDSIDIAETQLFQLTAFENVAQGEFTDYLSIFTADYSLAFTNAADSIVMGDFDAPFASLGWAGKGITVVSGGFFNQTLNSNGTPLGLWATTREGGPMVCLQPNALNLSAQVQFLHNSSSPILANARITINGQPWINNIQVHEASPFIPLQAGRDAVITIHSNLTQSPIDSIWTDTLNLSSGQSYQLFLTGRGDITSPFEIIVNDNIQPASASIDSLQISFFHGTSFFETISILADTASQTPIVSSLAFAEQPYSLPVPAQREEWIFTNTTDSIVTYDVPLNNSEWTGHALTCLTYGDEQSNSFSAWLASDEGGPMYGLQTLVIPIPPVFAAAQFIHASADESIQQVDVYINDSLYLDDFSFESATPFISIPANTPIDIAIALSNSSDTTAALLHSSMNAIENERYQFILWGIASNTGYNPAPPLQLALNSNLPQPPSAEYCALQFFHASTDAGQISITESTTPIVPFFNTLANGQFSFANFLVANQDYGLAIYNAGANFLYGNYALPLQTWNLSDSTLTIISCGFRGPANNSNGAPFKLLGITNNGNSTELPIFVGVTEPEKSELLIFPNPANTEFKMTWKSAATGKTIFRLVNSIGNTVWEKSMNTGTEIQKITVESTELSDGLYHLEAINAEVHFSQPIIIQH